MGASAFAFYRGAAAVMAGDIAPRPDSGLKVQLCGDAHLANFGGFASPERSMVFDINDFDETLPGPFEWDVQRLVASVEIASRSREFDDSTRRKVVSDTAKSYRNAIRNFATMSNLDIWYSHLDVDAIVSTYGDELGGAAIKRLQRTIEKAGSKDRLKAKTKLTEMVDGELRFISDPPLLVPAHEVFSVKDHQRLFDTVEKSLREYRATLSPDRRHLFEGYRFVDLARKVVGVGSVGTRSWVALLVGRDDDDPLFIQVKEAEASVLEPYAGDSAFDNHGQRVVEGQRLMQAVGDILLGWDRVEAGEGADDRVHDYYMRQLWDWKASADITNMDPSTLNIYGQTCGWVLARSHARSGDPIAIGSYLGGGNAFDRAMTTFASSYADQNERDHQQFVDAIADGTIEAETGI